jgi:twitching motility protein PilU
MDTPRIKDLIKKGETDALKEAMEQGVQEGCQTFDLVLFEYYRAGRISLDQALTHADSANNLRLKIKLAGLDDDAPTRAGAAAAAKPAAQSSILRIPGIPGVRKP